MLKSKKLVNLTPHTINIIIRHSIEIPPSGIIARCKTDRQIIDSFILEDVEDVDGWDITVPVIKTRFGEVEGLPEPQEGTIYIVSHLVAQAVPDREDVFFPDDLVRDSQGNVVGCRALGKI